MPAEPTIPQVSVSVPGHLHLPPPVLFDHTIGDFKIFLSRMKNNFITYDVTSAAKKKSYLLSSLSDPTYKLLYSLCFPADPDDESLTFDTLEGKLKAHFRLAKSAFSARLDFYVTKQKSDESVIDYSGRLRTVAASCAFGNELDVVLRDVFTFGLSNHEVRDRIMEEDAAKTDFTFAKAIEIATTKEGSLHSNTGGVQVKQEPGAGMPGPSKQITPRKPPRSQTVDVQENKNEFHTVLDIPLGDEIVAGDDPEPAAEPPVQVDDMVTKRSIIEVLNTENEQLRWKAEDKSDEEYSQNKKSKGAAPKGKKSAKGKKKNGGSDSDSGDDWKSAGKKARKTGAKRCEFLKTCTLTPELAAVVGSDQMFRHEVVKKIWSIIKEKNLYDPNDKQYAICNGDLMKVIGTKRFRTFEMMKYLQKHFLD